MGGRLDREFWWVAHWTAFAVDRGYCEFCGARPCPGHARRGAS